VGKITMDFFLGVQLHFTINLSYFSLLFAKRHAANHKKFS